MGFTRAEFDKPRLDMAPFLFYKIREPTYQGFYARVVQLIRTVPPIEPVEQDAPPPPATDPTSNTFGRFGRQGQLERQAPIRPIEDPNRRVHGPVYLFVAYDIERAFIEGFLFFPSMTKKAQKWPNHYFLGMAHRWMYRLIHGPDYRIARPRSSCSVRVQDRSLEMGCRTESSFRCMQSKRMHKKMGLFRRRKNRELYPAIYYRMYNLNLAHPAVRDFVHPTSLSVLHRNILPSDLDMFMGCRYMLVSPSQQYFYVLNRSMLTLFRSMGNEDITALCMRNRPPRLVVPVNRQYFRGFTNTRAVLEDGMLRVYSQYDPEAADELVYQVQAASESAEPPFALVLEDSGRLVVYDATNRVVSSNLFDQPSQPLEDDEYDPVKDRRERMLQLIAYLKLIRLYRLVQATSDADTLVQVGRQMDLLLANDQLPPYNSTEDYIARLEKLLGFLIRTRRILPGDPNQYGFSLDLTDANNKDNTRFDFDEEEQDAKEEKQRTRPFEMPALPELPSVPIASQLTPAQGVTDDADEHDPCDDIDDDTLREKCVDQREASFATQEGEVDQGLHDMEGALASGDLDVTDLRDLMEGDDVADIFGKLTADGVASSSSTSNAAGARYQCPIPRNVTYSRKHDMYCRLIALRESIRRAQRKLVVLEDTVAPIQKQSPTSLMDANAPRSSIPEYNATEDMQARLELLRTLLKKA
jgi:hypothetical protein